MRVRKSLLSSMFVMGLVGVAGVNGATIPLVNGGFETPDGPNTDLIGWEETEFNGETWRVGSFNSPPAPWAAFNVANPEGARVGYLNATSSISQNSLHALLAGESYTLSAWIGNRLNDAMRPTDLVLYADNGSGGLGAILASTSVGDEGVPNGTYQQLSVSFDTMDPGNAALVAANLGRNLHVFIGHSLDETGGGEVTVDAVELSYVPEPASLSLLGMGALAAMRRRSR